MIEWLMVTDNWQTVMIYMLLIIAVSDRITDGRP